MSFVRPIGRRRCLALVAAFAATSMLLAIAPARAAQGPVGLGTADSFAVLAGSGITNTGPTTITGDMGTFPTPTETGFGSITLIGTNHAGDAVTQGAKNDLVTAYDDAAGRSPESSLPVELGGKTLLAGVYTSGTFGLTGTLTLDAQGVVGAEFVFKTASTLITASNSRVRLINAANPCNVVWKIGSSATFNTGTRFVGDVIALTSITAQTAATFRGRLLARNGAVTLDTNTISRATCIVPGAAGTPTTTPGASTPTTAIVGATPTVPSVTPGVITPGVGSPGPTTPLGTPGVPGAPTGGTPGTPGAPGTPSLTTANTPALPPFLRLTPATPPTTPAIPRSPLPRTGSDIFGLLRAGLMLLILGGVVVVATRHRRATHTA
jgi:hypothetical protein